MLRVSFFAGLLLAVSSAGALATDLLDAVTAEDEAVGYDWEGAYAGVDAGGWLYGGGNDYGYLNAHIGTNFVTDTFVFGLEGSAGVIVQPGDTFYELFANARAGVTASDQVLLYGIAGVGVEFPDDFSDAFPTYQAGVGVEIAVDDSTTIRGQVTALGFWDSGIGFEGVIATVGFNRHL